MPNYDRARQAVRQLVKDSGKVDKLDAVLNFADVFAGVVDNAQNLSGLFSAGGLSAAASLMKSLSDDGSMNVLPNIQFTGNGQDDPDSPVTADYFRGRALKNIGGSSLALVGVAASAGTAGVNVLSAVQHANATGLTVMHLQQLKSMASREKKMQRDTIEEWLNVVITAKSMKFVVRGVSLAGAVIPAASLGVGIGTAVAKIGIKMTLSKVVYATAAEIHWRAFQEQFMAGVVSGGTAKGATVGPASQIYWESFARHGLGRLLGEYDVAALVREPAGWLPLADKLMLI